jgi:hypothetical protein
LHEKIKPYVVKDDERNIVYTNCGYAQYKIGDIIKYIDHYGDEYIARIEGYNIDLDRKNISYLTVRLADNKTKILYFFNGEEQIIIEKPDTELKMPEPYKIGNVVSFIGEGNKNVIGKVIDINVIKIEGIIQNDKSFLTIEDGDKKLYKIIYNFKGLTKRSSDTILTKEINEPYKKGDKVSFIFEGKEIDGEVYNVKYVVIDYEIQDDKSELTIMNKSIDPFFWRIKLNDSTLKKILDPVSGKKKYILKDDSLYHIKYVKYKTKYLLEKNN